MTDLTTSLMTSLSSSGDHNSSHAEHSEELTAEEMIVERIMILCALLCTSTLIGAFLKKHHSQYFGESAAQIVLGFVIGLGIWLVSSEKSADTLLQFSPELFLVVLLPPIIYDAGYATKQVKFFKNFHTILGLAFVGTLFSALFGALIIYLGTMAMDSSGICQQFNGIQSLLYGALLSATDTVSVLSVLSHMPIDKTLYMLLFGEAALNDAVAVILFRLFFSFAETASEDSAFEINGGHAVSTTFIMIGVFFGSVALGMAFAMLLSLILKHFPLHQDVEENLLVLLFGYMAYLVAEHFHLSGIVSVLFAGIGMSAYTAKNLSPEAKSSSKTMVRLISLACEAAVFIYMGLSPFATAGTNSAASAAYNPAFIALSLSAVVFSRIHVFAIAAAANYLPWFKPNRHIPLRQQLFLWFANLRGGIAYILALQVATEGVNIWPDEAGAKFRQLVLGTVLVLVLITVVFGGGLTPVVIRLLGLLVADNTPDLEEIEDAPMVLPSVGGLDRQRSSWLVKNAKAFNKRVLLPFFTREKGVYSASFALEEQANMVELEENPDLQGSIDYNGRKFLIYTAKEGEISEAVKSLPKETRSYSNAKKLWIVELYLDITIPVLKNLVLHNGMRLTDSARAKIKEIDDEARPPSRMDGGDRPPSRMVRKKTSSSSSGDVLPPAQPDPSLPVQERTNEAELRKEFDALRFSGHS